MKQSESIVKRFFCKVGEIFMKPFKAVVKFFISIDWANVKVDTYIRYILMILTAVNTVLTHFGKNPIPYSEEAIYTTVSDIVTIMILIINTYKDNPTSKESIECTDLQRALKASNDLEEIKKILEKKLEEVDDKIEIEDSLTSEELQDIEQSDL